MKTSILHILMFVFGFGVVFFHKDMLLLEQARQKVHIDSLLDAELCRKTDSIDNLSQHVSEETISVLQENIQILQNTKTQLLQLDVCNKRLHDSNGVRNSCMDSVYNNL